MAGLRTRARGYALQVLYAADEAASGFAKTAAMNESKVSEDLFGFTLENDGVDFAQTILDSVVSSGDEIDEVIQAASKNWRLERMSKVDRNILRLGTAELMHDSEVPVNVVINEAIELAKLFGTGESAAFVNGILDRIASKVRGA